MSEIEEILSQAHKRLGNDYVPYRNHVIRVIHFCLALHKCNEDDERKLIIAACYHDLGIWPTLSLDYLPPSVDLAKEYLLAKNLSDSLDS